MCHAIFFFQYVPPQSPQSLFKLHGVGGGKIFLTISLSVDILTFTSAMFTEMVTYCAVIPQRPLQ